MAAHREEALQGHWVHSHEEDAGEEMVFRPASHEFPLSRGRISLELRPDGSYVESAPGPVDLPVESSGRWALESGDRLSLEAEASGPWRLWEVVAVGDDRLVVRPSQRP